MRTNDARQSSQMESRVARASNCSQSWQPAGKKMLARRRQFPQAIWKSAGCGGERS